MGLEYVNFSEISHYVTFQWTLNTPKQYCWGRPTNLLLTLEKAGVLFPAFTYLLKNNSRSLEQDVK